MTDISTHRFQNNGNAGAVRRVLDQIKWLTEAYRARRARKTAEAEMGSLDDRILADMGLSRCEISYRAAQQDGAALPHAGTYRQS